MKYLPLILSSLLIILSFFLWIFFKKTKNNEELEILQNKKYYINIEQLKTKLKINNDNKNIIIRVNGEKLEEKKIIEIKK